VVLAVKYRQTVILAEDNVYLNTTEFDQLPRRLFSQFEAKGKLLTGQKFLKTNSSPCFSNSGLIGDPFQTFGKKPD